MTPLRDVTLALLLIGTYLAASYDPRTEPASSHQTTGEASWFDDGPGLYGAVHSYRWGDPRYRVEVCRADDDDVCVTVTVRDHMANPVRAIDLSPAAFSRLAPLSRGVVQVTVSRAGAAPLVTTPPTDTAP